MELAEELKMASALSLPPLEKSSIQSERLMLGLSSSEEVDVLSIQNGILSTHHLYASLMRSFWR